MIAPVHLIYFAIVLAAGLASLAALQVRGRPAQLLAGLPIVALVSLAVSWRDVQLGADTRIYLEMYSHPERFERFVETAYIAAIRLLRHFSTDGTFYLFASAFAANLIVYLGFARFNPRLAGFAFALYCASPVFWTVNILILRNGLAAALILHATLILVTAGRSRSFFALALAGGGFHYSALGHALFLSAADLSTARRTALSAGALICAGAALILLFPYVSGSATPWIERFEDYQHYAATGQFAYENASLKPQHAIPLLVLLGALLEWRRLQDTEKLLLRYYLALLILAALFWDNVLFRDRIYLPAQMMEPLFLALFLRRVLREDVLFAVGGFAFFLMLAAGTILIWGPRNVLQVY
ncbi:EpsG family protein [Leisingera sp. M658]|uniref:EpsG family protein n=1 Tax=Leisingera sp. M658 TaxID=2867015 RepID=UPI0021A7F30A|nr:EpsG family protein [Leisingera sp. M658]UWQ77549.1 EpsG family protein [Leisingera sp. M658]